jgi:hypothetical protein
MLSFDTLRINWLSMTKRKRHDALAITLMNEAA